MYDLQNTIQSQDTTGEPVPFETTWRSHSTAICRDWLAKHNRIATHYCRTHRFDAPVPLHKVPRTHANDHSIATHYSTNIPLRTKSQHMKSTKVHSRKADLKFTWKNRQLHCTSQHRQSKIRHVQSDDALQDRRNAQAYFLRFRNLPLPEKNTPALLLRNIYLCIHEVSNFQLLFASTMTSAKHSSESFQDTITQVRLLYSYHSLLYLYSTSTLPLFYSTQARLHWTLLYLYCFWASSRTCDLPDLLTQVPTGHNDLWASENVTSWSLKAHANWTQWFLKAGADLWASENVTYDLLRHMPTGHNDLWASENVTSWSLKAHANWTQWSLC